jgi:hypothetical protein
VAIVNGSTDAALYMIVINFAGDLRAPFIDHSSNSANLFWSGAGLSFVDEACCLRTSANTQSLEETSVRSRMFCSSER